MPHPQEHSPYVLADEPEENHNHPREEPDGDHDGGPPDGHGRHEQFADEDHQGADQSGDGENDAHVTGNAKGYDTEAHDIGPKAHQTLEGVAGFAVDPVEVLDRNASDIFGRPQEEPLQMRILAFVLDDIIPHELLDDPEA